MSRMPGRPGDSLEAWEPWCAFLCVCYLEQLQWIKPQASYIYSPGDHLHTSEFSCVPQNRPGFHAVLGNTHFALESGIEVPCHEDIASLTKASLWETAHISSIKNPLDDNSRWRVKTRIEDYTQSSRNGSDHRAGELEKKPAEYCKYAFSSDLVHIASNIKSFIQSSQGSLTGAKPHNWNIGLLK